MEVHVVAQIGSADICDQPASVMPAEQRPIVDGLSIPAHQQLSVGEAELHSADVVASDPAEAASVQNSLDEAELSEKIVVFGTDIALEPDVNRVYQSVRKLARTRQKAGAKVANIIRDAYGVKNFTPTAASLVENYLRSLEDIGLVAYDEDSTVYQPVALSEILARNEAAYREKFTKSATQRASTTVYKPHTKSRPKPANPAEFAQQLVTGIDRIIYEETGDTEMRHSMLFPKIAEALQIDSETARLLLDQLVASGNAFRYQKSGRPFYSVHAPASANGAAEAKKISEGKEKPRRFTQTHMDIAVEVMDAFSPLHVQQRIEVRKLWNESKYRDVIDAKQFNAALRIIEKEGFLDVHTAKPSKSPHTKIQQRMYVKVANQMLKREWKDNRAAVVERLKRIVDEALEQASESHES